VSDVSLYRYSIPHTQSLHTCVYSASNTNILNYQTDNAACFLTSSRDLQWSPSTLPWQFQFPAHTPGRHNPDIAYDLFPEKPEKWRTWFSNMKEAHYRDLAGEGVFSVGHLLLLVRNRSRGENKARCNARYCWTDFEGLNNRLNPSMFSCLQAPPLCLWKGSLALWTGYVQKNWEGVEGTFVKAAFKWPLFLIIVGRGMTACVILRDSAWCIFATLFLALKATSSNIHAKRSLWHAKQFKITVWFHPIYGHSIRSSIPFQRHN